MTFNLPPPDLQVSFALKLIEARSRFLQDALKAAVRTLDIVELDRQLAVHAPRASLSMLASHGLRGEPILPVPLVLEKSSDRHLGLRAIGAREPARGAGSIR
jgi:XcyI restriction endonuclease